MNKNIAIVIPGHFRNVDYENIKKNILDVLSDNNYSYKIFISTWNNRGFRIDGTMINDIYSPKLKFNLLSIFNYEDCDIEEEIVDFSEYKSNNYIKYKYCENTCIDSASQWYKNYKCYKLIEKYIENKKEMFDGIIKIRFDLYFHNPLNINFLKDSIENKVIYMPEWHKKYEIVTRTMMDQFFFGDFSSMSKVLSLFSDIKYYLGNDIPHTSESFLYETIKKYNLNLNRFNTSYSLIRINKLEKIV